MIDKPIKYKDLEVKCECGRKIKIAYPIPALSEYHGDMYISQEMEYQERKQLQSNWNSLREWLDNLINDDRLNSTISSNLMYVLDKMNELEGKDKE